jgi:hypothetical protein
MSKIYFDPVALPADEGYHGVRCTIVTDDGTVRHVMTMAGAKRRMDDFNDAIEAARMGLTVNDSLTAEDILGELNPNGQAF